MSLVIGGIPTCTAFLVNTDTVLTNQHCCPEEDSCSDAVVVARYRGVLGNSDAFYNVRDEVGRWDAHDLLALRVDGSPGDEFRPVVLAGAADFLGASIYIAGHPRGRPLESSLGRLFERRDEITYVYRTATKTKVEQILYWASADNGSSGSPVFLLDANVVVGIHHSGGLDPEELGLTTAHTDGFMRLLAGTDGSAIMDVLADAGIPFESL